MNHIQGMAMFKGKGRNRRVEVAVLAHSANGQSTILFSDGKQDRVLTSSLQMIIPQKTLDFGREFDRMVE